MACQVLSSVSARAFSLVQGTFLALRYTERTFIKFLRLYAPHIRRCDDDPTVGTSLTFIGGKTRTVIFNWRYKYSSKPIRLFTFILKSSCTYILNPVKFSAKLMFLFSIKSMSKELFLIFVSFLLPLTHIFSLLSFFFSHSFLPLVLL